MKINRVLVHLLAITGGLLLLPATSWAQCTNCTTTLVGSDVVHTFTANGTFTPPSGITAVQYLVVGGGAGGGGVFDGSNLGGAGGGGAGGYQAATGFAVTPLTVYAITVGAGGAEGVGNASQGGTGGNSIFSTVTANGGGGGASAGVNNDGVNGASGGGARITGNTGGNGTVGQGNNGGNGNNAAGGGGGASAAGANGGATIGGAGGSGTVNNITGVNVTYAAGGSGGNYDGTRAAGGAGAANTGNGGGGASGNNGGNAFNGGTGGSGIVIIRYTTATPTFTCSSGETFVSGLLGSYYDYTGQTFPSPPPPTGPATGTRVDGPVDFNWATGAPGVVGIGANLFAVRWDGALHVTTSGTYQFQTVSDDGVRLWINNVLVIDNWTDHAPFTNTSGNVPLMAGITYSVRLEFYENGGGAEIRLRWGPSGGPFIAIPAGPLPLGEGLYYCASTEPSSSILANYRMDEAAWTGVANEILDSSGNGNHASPLGGVNTDSATPARGGNPGTCGYGTISANTSLTTFDAASTPFTPGVSGSITFWYNSNTVWTNNASRMLFDASSNNGGNTADKQFFLVRLATSGRLRFVIEDSADLDTEAETGNLAFAAGTWVHIGVTWDLPNDLLEIYINGSLADTSTTDVDGAMGTLNTLYMGDNRTNGVSGSGYSGNSANGLIDEVRVYSGVLTPTEIIIDWLATHPCSLVDHFEIAIGGNSASTCNPKSITITAQDSVNNTITNYGGTITLSTSSDTGDWSQPTVTGVLNNGAADDGQATYTFDTTDNGVKLLELTNAHADDLTILVVDSTVPTSLSTSSTINFRDNAFVITNDTIQVAGRDQTMSAAMWRRDTTTGDCAIATGYTGTQNLDAWHTRDGVDPGGAAPFIGALTLPDTMPAVNSAVNNLTLTFAGGVTNFVLSTTDVGKYVLNLRDDTRSFATGVDIIGTSNSITTRPFALVISNVDGASVNPSGAAPTDDVFGVAGVPFDTTVGAYRYSAAADSDNDGLPDAAATLAQATAGGLTPMYATALTLTLAASGFTPATGVLGTLSNSGFSSFVGGQQTRSDLQYSEVGSFVFQTANPLVTNYLNSAGVNLWGTYFNVTDTQTNATRVGRFIPDHFSLIGTGDRYNRVNESCSPPSTFTYMDEELRLEFVLTARNAANNITQNYTDGFDLLNLGTPASFQIGAIDTDVPTPLTTRVTAISSSGTWTSGTSSLVSVFVRLNRDINTDGPYENLNWGIAPVDSDGVNMGVTNYNLDVDSDSTDDHALIAANEVRYGRTFIESTSGSELLSLVLPLRAEYWNGTQFILNTNDSCTTYDANALTYSNPNPGGFGVTDNNATGTLDQGGYGTIDPVIQISSNGQQPGSVCVAHTVPGYLRFNWAANPSLICIDPDGDPSAKATFGIYDFNTPQIYTREVY